MKKRKLLSYLMIISILSGMLVGIIPVEAEASGYYSYSVNADGTTCTIEGYTGAEGALTIPDTLDGKTVTAIGDQVFSWIQTSITIPASVTAIDSGAFMNCMNLTVINVAAANEYFSSQDGVLYNSDKTELLRYPVGLSGSTFSIPDGVTTIGENAFYYSPSLTGIKISNSVTAIRDTAFGYCSKLTDLTIPSSVESIGGGAFVGCLGLTGIDIAAGNTHFSYQSGVLYDVDKSELVYYSPQLTESVFNIPDDIKSISGYAFYNCGALTTVAMPEGVTSIGDSAFNNCTNLTGVTIPDSLTYIGDGAFANCLKLADIYIPEKVKHIGRAAFTYCVCLEKVVIPNGITAIEKATFSDCYNLTGIEIPDSVITIGEDAFYHCWGITSATIPGSVTSIGQCAFLSCEKLTNINIPNSVTSIGERAFQGCSELTGITIPSSVMTIENYAFSYCGTLASVYFDGNMPTLNGSEIFANCSSSLQFYCRNGNEDSFTSISVLTLTTKDITVTPILNGTITPSTSYGMTGETISLKIMPDAGYRLKAGSLKYNDIDISGISFSMPDNNVTICGEFEKIAVPVVSVTPDTGATQNQKPVWSWADATGKGYYRYKLNSEADWIYTMSTGYTPADELSDDSYTLYVQELDSSGYWSGSGSAGIKVDTTAPTASLTSMSGGSVAVDISSIILSFNEPVTAVTNKKVSISNETSIFTYTIGASGEYITVTDSVYSAVIPVSKFVYDTGQLVPTYNTTYIIEAEAGAYIDTAGNETAPGSIGSFKTEAAPVTFVVTFKDWDNEVLKTETVEEGNGATAPKNPEREGYIFTGWDIAYNNVLSDLTVKAQYIEKTIPVTDADRVAQDKAALNIGFAAGDSAVSVTQNLILIDTGTVNGSAITWQSDNTGVIDNDGGVTRPLFSGEDEEVTLTAYVYYNGASDAKAFSLTVLKLEPAAFTVTFMDWDGTVLKTETVEEGQSATAPADPARPGYTFIGWDTAYSKVLSNLTVTAQYNQIQAALQGIAITTPASKLIYKVGDSLDISGMVVTGTYSDGTEKVVSITAANVSGFDSSIPAASRTLTVTVEGKTATYTIRVIAEASNGNKDSDRHRDSTPAAVVPAEAPIIEVTFTEGKVTATTTAAAEADSNGKATIAATQAQVSAAIGRALEEAAKEGKDTIAIAAIKAEVPASARTVEAILSQTAVVAAAGSDIDALTITTPVASIAFDSQELDAVADQAEDEVRITAGIVNTNTLSEAIKQVAGNRPVYDFKVISGDKTISQFGENASVRVSIPYTPIPVEDINSIVIYYINSEGKPEIVSNCVYDRSTGTISFTTNHFSKYGIGYNKVDFKDVPASEWYSEAVSFIAARGIANGAGSGTFNPDARLTRGECMVMLMRACGLEPDSSLKNNFADSGNTYYTGYLAAAKRLEISDGIGNNLFAPDNELTRQEMFTLLYNTLKATDKLPAGASEKHIPVFSDAARIASWAKDGISLLTDTDIISGNGGRLAPESTATRAEMAQMLYNLLVR